MTATAFVDACGFIPVSSGTGDFVVSSAVTGYQTPASAGAVNAAVYSYRAESADKSQWEIGFGVYTSGSTTLARTTVNASSTGSKVSFSAAPNVYITAATADLQNAAFLTAGTLPIARLNGGSANQFAQGDGTFQLQGRKLLNTINASNVAALQDTTSFTSAFTNYELEFNNILAVAGNVTVNLQVHSGGSYQSSSYITGSIGSNTGGAFGAGLATTTALSLSQFVQSTGPGFCGSMRIFGPSGTTYPKAMEGKGFSTTVTPASWYVLFGGYWNSTAAVDGFQVLAASGNTTGIIKVFGLN